MSIRPLAAIALLTGFLVLPFSAPAQVLYGSLTGNVTDKSGAAVPDAKVDATNIGTGISKQTQTDDRGVYRFQDCQAGTYKVTIGATGFAGTVETGVQITENTERRIDVQLEVANLGQTVTVTASDTAVLQTDRADVNVQVSEQEIADLPMTGANGSRNFESVFVTIPGFTPPAASNSTSANPSEAQAYNVNGNTGTGTNMKLDGASNIYPWLPSVHAYIPPADAVQTVNVATNSLDAEQGIASGAAINVILKSGTNQFHGAAWEYNTDSALKARNFFYYSGNLPKNIVNQFGVDVGGPIEKNKLFFFADWERTARRTLANKTVTVAPTAIRGGNFSATGTTIYDPTTGAASGTGRTPFPNDLIPASSISPAATKLIAMLPQPNLAGTSNNYFASGDVAFTRDAIDFKLNYNPNQKSSVFGRYSIQPSAVYDPSVFGMLGGGVMDSGQPGTSSGRIQSVSLGGTYIITPSLLFDGNAAYTRMRLGTTADDIGKNYGSDVLGIPGSNGPSWFNGGYPNFNVSNYAAFGNTAQASPFLFRDSLYVYSGNLSWVKGPHNFRFGGELFHFNIIQLQANAAGNLRGTFNFTGGLTTLNGGKGTNANNSWADFLLGLPNSMSHSYQYINPAALYEDTWAFYARDQWQVNAKLTVSYGIRYELYPYSHAEHGIDGIWYDPATNIVHFAGTNVETGNGQFAPRLGVAYRLNESTVLRAGYGITTDPEAFRNNVQTYPEVLSATYSAPNSYSAAGSLTTGIPGYVGPDLKAASVVLPTNFTAITYANPYRRGYAETYNVTIQRNLGKGYNLQAGYVGTRGVRPGGGVNINAAPPGTGVAGQPLYQQWGNSNAIAEIEPIRGSRYDSLQARATHRMRGVNLGVAYTFSKTLDAADNEEGTSLTWNWAPVQYRNYALAGYDRTHNVQFYGSYSLPFGKGESFLRHGFASKLAGGWQANWILSKESGTPFTVGASATSLNSPGNTQTANQVLPTVEILGGYGPGMPYFDPKAFAAVTTVTFGNTGRDILRGPGMFALHASVFRTFPVRESIRLQFRAEAFGLTNTPTFGNPSATVGSSSLGIISSSSGDRQIRFAMKVTF